MSIQIFEDNENVNWNLSKKCKREDSKMSRSNVPKPNKRVALGNLTNNTNVLTTRVQPSRAAKGKTKSFATATNKQENRMKTKREDVKVPSYVEALSTITAKPTKMDSPMLLSPACDTDSFDEIKSDEISFNIDDVTAKLDTVFGCPEYAHDIHNYLKKLELKFRPKRHYMTKQVDINAKMRAILIDWLVEVAEEYKLNLQTLYLTVNYIDRFLSCMSVLRGKLQLVGAACMLVAAKFEEIYPPEVSEFVYITDDSYTAKQVLRMEHLLLKTLSFDISVPTCDSFFTRYLLAAGAAKDSQLHFLVQYICELCLLDCDISLQYPPSMVTISAVYVAKTIMGLPPWTASQEFYSGYQLGDITACIRDLHRLHSNAKSLEQQAVQSKYRTPKYGGVSNLPPATSLLL